MFTTWLNLSSLNLTIFCPSTPWRIDTFDSTPTLYYPLLLGNTILPKSTDILPHIPGAERLSASHTPFFFF